MQLGFGLWLVGGSREKGRHLRTWTNTYAGWQTPGDDVLAPYPCLQQGLALQQPKAPGKGESFLTHTSLVGDHGVGGILLSPLRTPHNASWCL